MTTPITKERLIKIQKWRETYGAGSNVVLPAEEAEELARIALAAMDAEPVADVVAWHKEGEERTCDIRWRRFDVAPGPLFTVAQPGVTADADDNFYSWFGREWHEHYQQNQYTTAAKQMLGVMAESAWNACRAAMLQAGNYPAIPDGWQLVPVEPTLEMIKSGANAASTGMLIPGMYRAMLTAAPQQEGK